MLEHFAFLSVGHGCSTQGLLCSSFSGLLWRLGIQKGSILEVLGRNRMLGDSIGKFQSFGHRSGPNHLHRAREQGIVRHYPARLK